MNTYIVYVKTKGEKLVHDKRFDAKNYTELVNKASEYFRFIRNCEVVRVEEVKRLMGDVEFSFGANFISTK